MNEPRDDELAARLRDAATQAGRAASGRSGGALDRALRRRRNGVAGQAALATVLVVLAVTVAPRWFDGAPAGGVLSGGASESPSETPGPAESLDPSPRPSAESTPSTDPEPKPSGTPSMSPSPPPRPAETAPSASASEEATQSPLGSPGCSSPSRATKPAGVSVALAVSDTSVRNDDDVSFTVTYRNDGPSTMSYEHGSNYVDVVVVDDEGAQWVYSHDRAYTMELRQANHPPGTRLEETLHWTVSRCGVAYVDGKPQQRMEPGTYRAYGLWAASNNSYWWSDPVTMTVQ